MEREYWMEGWEAERGRGEWRLRRPLQAPTTLGLSLQSERRWWNHPGGASASSFGGATASNSARYDDM